MKKYLLVFLTLLVFTGCSVTRIDNLDYKDISDKILSLNIRTYNKIGKGYKYYAPRGVVRTDSNSYNDVLKRKDINYYLYVDIVSYYYKTKSTYKTNEKAYYSKEIKNGKKTGYIQITEKKDKLFVQVVYNYAKIEAYVTKNNLNQALEDISYMISSIKFNDSLLKKMYESGNLESKEEVYKLFDNKEKNGNFIEYIKEYDKYDGEDEVVPKEEEIEVKTSKQVTTTTKEVTTNAEAKEESN